MKIVHAQSKKEYAYCVYLRTLVHVNEQNCPLGDIFNDKEESSEDFIGYIDGKPIATARYHLNKNVAKIGALAVLKEYRGQGFGREIMEYLIAHIRKKFDVSEIQLSSQKVAKKFYEKLGFFSVGEEYIEAHIPHCKMILQTDLLEEKNG